MSKTKFLFIAEGEDYMSDAFLPPDSPETQRKKRRRIEQEKKKTLPLAERMRVSREEGLSQALPTSNLGHKLLTKMGYKEGAGIGKTKQGMVAPIAVKVRPAKQGLGEDTRQEKEIDAAMLKSKQEEEALLAAYLANMRKRAKYSTDDRLEYEKPRDKNSQGGRFNAPTCSSGWPRICPLCPNVTLNSQVMAVTHSQGKKHRKRMLQADQQAAKGLNATSGLPAGNADLPPGGPAGPSEPSSTLTSLYYLNLYTKLRLKKDIEYSEFEVTGPQHCQNFRVRIMLDGRVLAEGQGATKKKAKQNGAATALLVLSEEAPAKAADGPEVHNPTAADAAGEQVQKKQDFYHNSHTTSQNYQTLQASDVHSCQNHTTAGGQDAQSCPAVSSAGGSSGPGAQIFPVAGGEETTGATPNENLQDGVVDCVVSSLFSASASADDYNPYSPSNDPDSPS